MDESGDASGRRATPPDDSVAPTSGEVRHSRHAPSHCIGQARRYLDLLAGGDAPHCFQPYHDLNPNDPETAWLRRTVYGPLGDVWPELVARQTKGAAIAVTMAETDGRGRKLVNMIRPRAVWIEADGPLPCALPIPPTITVQQVLIAVYGSVRRAAHRTPVLRVPGTLRLKDLAHPHLVRILEDLTSEQIYTAAEIAAAFPLRPSTMRSRHRDSAARLQRADRSVEPGAEWYPPSIIAALQSSDARLQESDPFIAQGDRAGDEPIPLDWSRRDCWKELAPRLQSGMPQPGDGIAACRSPGVSGPRGRKLRPPPGGIPGIRECAMTTVVPCLSLRHGIWSVRCRRPQASRLFSATAAHLSMLHQHRRGCRWWLPFNVNHSSRPSPLLVDLVVVDQAARLLEVDGHA
jgi:hypothetical protein